MRVLGPPSAPRPRTSAGFPVIAATACWTASAASRRSPFTVRPTAFFDKELWATDAGVVAFSRRHAAGAGRRHPATRGVFTVAAFSGRIAEWPAEVPRRTGRGKRPDGHGPSLGGNPPIR